jgi:prepilin-type N-terminal cleavage/methylation domain-containing protein
VPPEPIFSEVKRALRVRLRSRAAAEDGVSLVEVLIAIVIILSVSLLTTTSVTTSLNQGEVGTQRLQAARILATVLSTGGCGATSTVSELGTTFSATVTPGSCSAGVTETGTITWKTNSTSYQMVMTSDSRPTSGAASAYAVTT